MVFVMMRWWYTRGWALCLTRTQARGRRVAQNFSAGQILGSLFAPWRQIVAGGGRNIQERLQDAVSNGVSRLVGFVIRFFVLLASGVIFIGIGVFGVVEVVAWPLVPLALAVCLVRGVTG
ncbi:MAG TPA: hypothetical protein VIM53_02910 [Candidatus Saccharimonadales bacterium]